MRLTAPRPSGSLATNDPRGLAVGFALGTLAAFTTVATVCTISPWHRWRDYRNHQQLKHGVLNIIALAIVVPAVPIALYGTIHLLINGP